jgi:hypothetical protein
MFRTAGWKARRFFSVTILVMRKILVVLLVVAGSVSAQDSPLVALAKRTNRKASKTPVITNATVAASQGRMSMAAGEAAAAQSQTATPAAAATEAAAATPAAVPPAPAVQYVAPKTITRAAPVVTSYMPQPASTARNIEVQSTAVTIAPVSTVQNIEPASSARTVEPPSSARNVEPASTVRFVPADSTNKPPL